MCYPTGVHHPIDELYTYTSNGICTCTPCAYMLNPMLAGVCSSTIHAIGIATHVLGRYTESHRATTCAEGAVRNGVPEKSPLYHCTPCVGVPGVLAGGACKGSPGARPQGTGGREGVPSATHPGPPEEGTHPTYVP